MYASPTKTSIKCILYIILEIVVKLYLLKTMKDLLIILFNIKKKNLILHFFKHITFQYNSRLIKYFKKHFFQTFFKLKCLVQKILVN